MHTELLVRFGYGSIVPWATRRHDGRRQFVAGPDRLVLAADVPLRGRDMKTVGRFEVREGEEVGFVLSWTPSRSEEHTSELQSLMRISYAVFCLKKKITNLQSVLRHLFAKLTNPYSIHIHQLI